MPNYCTTHISASRKEMVHALLNERGVDFNRIIPEPENIETGDCPGVSKDHGDAACWWDWRIENWGTKWNASDFELDEGDLGVAFETAWAPPGPVLVALSRMFPNTPLDVEWATEDAGQDVGMYALLNGERMLEHIPEPGSREAYEMAARIRYGMTHEESLLETYGGDETDEDYLEELERFRSLPS